MSRVRPAYLSAAVSVSAIGMAMSAAASADRGATLTDAGLMMAASLAVTGAAHVLPAISRGVAARTLWAACLLVVVYGHAAFFAASSQRAGAARATAVHQTAQADALRDELQGLAARPLAAVAADLAAARGKQAQTAAALARCDAATPGRCSSARAAVESAGARVQALAIESASAQRADELRAQITAAAGREDAKRQAATADPAAAALSLLTGVSAEHLQSGMLLLTALLVELFAVLLWTKALPRAAEARPHWVAEPQDKAAELAASWKASKTSQVLDDWAKAHRAEWRKDLGLDLDPGQSVASGRKRASVRKRVRSAFGGFRSPVSGTG